MTQEDLAAESDVSQSYINYLENNDKKRSPTLRVIERIADALGICPILLIVCDEHCTKCKQV